LKWTEECLENSIYWQIRFEVPGEHEIVSKFDRFGKDYKRYAKEH